MSKARRALNIARYALGAKSAERRVLEILEANGPQWNGELGIMAGLVWNSRVFQRLRAAGLTSGHPIAITDAGRKALHD